MKQMSTEETKALLAYMIRRAEKAEQHAMQLARQLEQLRQNPKPVLDASPIEAPPVYLEFSGYVQLPENAQLEYCGDSLADKRPISPITIADWRTLPKSHRENFHMLHEEIVATLLATSYKICWERECVIACGDNP